MVPQERQDSGLWAYFALTHAISMALNYAVSLVWMSFDGGVVDRLVVALVSVGLAAAPVRANRPGERVPSVPGMVL